MKRHARTAFNKLKKLGVPVICHPGQSEHFTISGEDNDTEVWADYYQEYGMHNDSDHPGVHPIICEVLKAAGLFSEWQNPGVLNVYDA